MARPTTSRRHLAALAFTLATVAVAASPHVAHAQLTSSPLCAAAGTGTSLGRVMITTSTTWTRAASPYRLDDTVTMSGAGVTLVIEPGVLVCASNRTALLARSGARILARGTSADPIVFTAAWQGQSWKGFAFVGAQATPSELRHVLIEYALIGAYSDGLHALVIDSTRIRQSFSNAVLIGGAGARISHSVVDTNRSGDAVQLFDSVTFEATTVRGAYGAGIALLGRGIRLLGGRVEGSGGVGLLDPVDTWMQDSSRLREARPLRITGSAVRPVKLGLGDYACLHPTPDANDSLRGNAADTVVLRRGRLGGGCQPRLALDGSLPIHVDDYVTVGTGGQLDLRPGTRIAFASRASVRVQGGRLLAQGTPASPIVLTAAQPGSPWGGLALSGTPPDTSRITNVTIDWAQSAIDAEWHPVAIDSVHILHSTWQAVFLGNGGRLSRSIIDTAAGWSSELRNSVVLWGDALLEETIVRGSLGNGIRVAQAGSRLLRCEVTGSRYDGILLEPEEGATVRLCNIEGNGGRGIARGQHGGAGVADARWNWWGDPAGPNGPNGDGVADAVRYEPWLASRVDIHNPPTGDTYVVVTPDSARLTAAGASVQLAAQRYEGGNPVAGTFEWSARNRNVATVSTGGLVTAVANGVTWVVATATDGVADSSRIVVGSLAAAVDCAASGGTNVGKVTLAASTTWTRAASPYRLGDTLTVSGAGVVLSAEPGVLVCAAQRAVILARNGARLDMRGTPADPVAFTAADTVQGWVGFNLGGAPSAPSVLANVIVEHHGTGGPTSGIGTWDGHRIVIDSALIRYARWSGVTVSGGSRISRSTVIGSGANTGGAAGVELQGGSTFEDTRVIGSAGSGVLLNGHGIRLLGGSIERSGTYGIDSPAEYFPSGEVPIPLARLAEARPLRVFGTGYGPARVSVPDFALLYPTPAEQDSLRGNPVNIVVLSGGELIGRSLTLGSALRFRVQDTVYVQDNLPSGSGTTLRLEPGAHLMFHARGALVIGQSRLVARGTAAAPITLTTVTPGTVWGGVELWGTARDTSVFTNVLIEHAGRGIYAAGRPSLDANVVVIDSSRIRHTSQPVTLGRQSRMSRSFIAEAPLGANAAIVLGDESVLEDVRIDGAGFFRGVILRGSGIRLRGLTIDGFGKDGLRGVGILGGNGRRLAEAERVRVTGGVGGGIWGARYQDAVVTEVSLDDFATLAPTPAEQDGLTGNACDCVVIEEGSLAGRALTLGPALRYTFDGDPNDHTIIGAGATLAFLPGVEFRVSNAPRLIVGAGGRLLARGTSAAPVRFGNDGWHGFDLQGTQADTAIFEHVLFEDVSWGIRARTGHVALVSDAQFRQTRYSAVVLGGAGSRLAASVIDTTLVPDSAAIVLGTGTTLETSVVRDAAGAGVQVTGADVTLRRCEVTASGGDGVSFDASAGGSVQDCNLVDNAGVGVRNAAPASVDARWNWWGDAAGPLGPAGDGVAGNVLYDPWHTRRVDIDDPPPHAVIYAVVTPDSVRLTSAGDTARLAAQLYEGTTPAVGSIDWTTRDVTVATVDATGLVTAVADGVTWVLATPPAPGLADSALVRVVIPPRPPLVVAILTPSRDTTVTLGDSLWLSARTEDPADSLTLAWRLSDGRTFAGATPGWVRFTAALADTIVATATRDAQQAAATRVVTVTLPNALPVVAFVAPAADTTAIAPDSILFRVEARDGDGAIAEYRWDFGDGRTATGASLDSLWRAYASPGRYAVTVRVVDDSGAVSEPAVRGVDVAPNLAPLATIVGLRDTTIALGDSLRLAGEGSDPDGIVSAYEWRLDDGRTFAQREPGWVTFARVDTVLVQLWVTDDRGLRSLAPAAVTVTVLRPNVRPVATILAPRADTTVVAGDSILVDGGATDDDGAIVVWAWRLDDTRTSATARPGWVTYPAAGRFALALAVTDDSGAVSLPDTVWITVRANAVPTVAIIAPAADTTIYVGDSVRVTAAASDADGDATTVEWTSASGAAVGETATGAGPHWLHFRRAGTYLVTAVARDWRGGVSSGATRTVEVRARGVNVVVTSGQSRDRVDGRDLVFVIRAMRTQDLRADVNGDGVVNATDLALVRAAFGRSPTRAASRSVP